MEMSRDDFIIAIRSAFLKKGYKQRFSLVVLLFFSIILIILSKYNFIPVNYFKISINEIVYRSSFIVSIPENYIKKSYTLIQNHLKLYSDYEITKNKLNELQSKKYNFEFIIKENNRLKKALEDFSYSSEEQIAKVLIDKQSPFLRSIVINKGSKNNIKKGMAVLNNSYLVGKVVEVNFATSRVLLLSDLNSKIPVIIEPGSVQSILSGDSSETGIIQYSNKNVPITIKSLVYTSGAGGLFKEGIPIGLIKPDVTDFQNEESKKKEVFFLSDFSQLSFVKVVLYERTINK